MRKITIHVKMNIVVVIENLIIKMIDMKDKILIVTKDL